jgi:hypothetical protein
VERDHGKVKVPPAWATALNSVTAPTAWSLLGMKSSDTP